MEIVLVRHAQPDWEPAPAGTAVDDPGLTALGAEQARLAAKALAGTPVTPPATTPFTAYYASPLRRVVETAARADLCLTGVAAAEWWLRRHLGRLEPMVSPPEPGWRRVLLQQPDRRVVMVAAAIGGGVRDRDGAHVLDGTRH